MKIFVIGFMIVCGVFIVAYLLSELGLKAEKKDKEDDDEQNKA